MPASRVLLLLVGLLAATPGASADDRSEAPVPTVEAPAPTEAAEARSLHLRVLDRDGIELPGVTVTLWRRAPRTPRETRVGSTDPEGWVRFEGLASATWAWRVERPGFETVGGRVAFRRYGTARVVLIVTSPLRGEGARNDPAPDRPVVDTNSAAAGTSSSRPRAHQATTPRSVLRKSCPVHNSGTPAARPGKRCSSTIAASLAVGAEMALPGVAARSATSSSAPGSSPWGARYPGG